MSRVCSWPVSLFLFLLFIKIAPSLVLAIKDEYVNLWESKTKVGHIVMRNAINDGVCYQKDLEHFFKNNAIKAILIEIESAGGSIGLCNALYQEILQFKQEYKKPVVVLSCTQCTSYAYYVACAADCIMCSPSAIIGGIGLRSSYEHIDKAVAEGFYQYFVHDVAARRGLSTTDALSWANGTFFTGVDALKVHLVDELGSFYNAIQKIKQLALIERDIQLIEPAEWALKESFVDVLCAIKNTGR